MRKEVHDPDDLDHDTCPDAYCCACECRPCKRAWWNANRPRPDDCPRHSKRTKH